MKRGGEEGLGMGFQTGVGRSQIGHVECLWHALMGARRAQRRAPGEEASAGGEGRGRLLP